MDTDEGTEDPTTPQHVADWVCEHGLLPEPADATSEVLDLVLALRAGSKGALTDNHQRAATDPPRDGALQIAAAELPLTLGAARPGGGTDGTWKRLKTWTDDECGWAFFDASKNQSRSWCEWGCGNRAKTRTYRARRRATAPGHETTWCPNGAVASHRETAVEGTGRRAGQVPNVSDISTLNHVFICL